eukprot:GHVU01088755.1.p2 GENE.GHVU01088755.1~~GHVU01088755.1.p2  ORF type:complete len:147 (-),score=15.70 GHVU01088755.1:70-453(-)
MPKYFCDYCDIYLTHSSPAGRRQHNYGRKHVNNKIEYYANLVREPTFVPPPHVTDFGMRPMMGPIPNIIRPPMAMAMGMRMPFGGPGGPGGPMPYPYPAMMRPMMRPMMPYGGGGRPPKMMDFDHHM